MAGWHHRLNEHELEQALGVCDGQGNLECCSQWGHKESDMTDRLNCTDMLFYGIISSSIFYRIHANLGVSLQVFSTMKLIVK